MYMCLYHILLGASIKFQKKKTTKRQSPGPVVNPLHYEDNFVNFPTIPLGFGGRGCN